MFFTPRLRSSAWPGLGQGAGRLAGRPSVGYQERSVGEDGMRAGSIGWWGLVGLLWSAAAPAQTVTLSFSHFLGPTSFFQEDVVAAWAQALEAKTGGKVKVEIHHGGMPLGKVTEQASQVKAGTVDIAL